MEQERNQVAVMNGECFLAMVCGVVEDVLRRHGALSPLEEEAEESLEQWMRMRMAA
jgi:hypothetical protein